MINFPINVCVINVGKKIVAMTMTIQMDIIFAIPLGSSFHPKHLII